MAEILKLLEQMDAAERRVLIEQINATWPEEDEFILPESERLLLVNRAKEAKKNGFPGRLWEDVLADLERANGEDKRAAQ